MRRIISPTLPGATSLAGAIHLLASVLKLSRDTIATAFFSFEPGTETSLAAYLLQEDLRRNLFDLALGLAARLGKNRAVILVAQMGDEHAQAR